jgi:hypothetical protein
VSDSNFINISFDAKQNQSNYRVEFFPIIDKFDDMIAPQDTYTPKNIKKYIIDAFTDIDRQTLDMETNAQNTVNIRKNLAYIDAISNTSGIHLFTKQLINLADDLSTNTQVTLNAGSKIYS